MCAVRPEIDLKVKLPGLLVKQGRRPPSTPPRRAWTKGIPQTSCWDDRGAIHRDRRHDRRWRMARRRRRSGDRLGGYVVPNRQWRPSNTCRRGSACSAKAGKGSSARAEGPAATARRLPWPMPADRPMRDHCSRSRRRWPVRPEVGRRIRTPLGRCHVGGPIRTGRHLPSPSAGGAVAPSRYLRGTACSGGFGSMGVQLRKAVHPQRGGRVPELMALSPPSRWSWRSSRSSLGPPLLWIRARVRRVWLHLGRPGTRRDHRGP